jgi:GNAT superfamily N-acetyltransferase
MILETEKIVDNYTLAHPDASSEWEVRKLFEFLESVRKRTHGMIRPRSEEEIREKIWNFVTIKDGDKIIACGEIFQTDNTFTLELGALAVDEEHQWNWLSDKIIDYAENHSRKERQYLIIITNNEILERKLLWRWYQLSPIRYDWRKKRSPGKNVYVKYFTPE